MIRAVHTSLAPSSSARINARSDGQDLAIGGSAVLLASVFGNGLNYALSIFLARVLGPNEFGLYALGLTIFNTGWLIALFGIDTGVIRFVSYHLGLDNLARSREILVQAVPLTTLSGALVGLALGGLAIPIADSLYHKPELAHILLGFSVAIPLSVLVATLIASLQAFKTIRYTILIKYLWEPMGKFIFMGILLYAGFGLLGVMLSIIITLFVSLLIAGRATLQVAEVRIGDFFSLRINSLRALFAFCLPLTVSNLMGVVAPRSDVLMLGYFVASDAVGIYLVAFQTAAILSLILGAIEPVLAPILGSVWAQGDLGRLREAYQTASRLTLLLTIPMYIFCVTFAVEVLSLFGSKFSMGVEVLIILATAQVIASSTGSANNILLMTGYSNWVMWNSICMGMMMIGGASLLIPKWGILGASIAAAINLLLTSLLRVIQVWYLHKIQPYSQNLLKIVLAGLITAGVMLFMNVWLSSSNYLLMVMLGGIAYLGSLAVLGFEESDKSAFKIIASRIRQTSNAKTAM